MLYILYYKLSGNQCSRASSNNVLITSTYHIMCTYSLFTFFGVQTGSLFNISHRPNVAGANSSRSGPSIYTLNDESECNSGVWF